MSREFIGNSYKRYSLRDLSSRNRELSREWLLLLG
jgi:hypothetical protein